MDSKEVIKKVVVYCAVCGLSFATAMGELGEIREGKDMKEHAHTHYQYQYLGTPALAIGTSASGVAISGDTSLGR